MAIDSHSDTLEAGRKEPGAEVTRRAAERIEFVLNRKGRKATLRWGGGAKVPWAVPGIFSTKKSSTSATRRSRVTTAKTPALLPRGLRAQPPAAIESHGNGDWQRRESCGDRKRRTAKHKGAGPAGSEAEAATRSHDTSRSRSQVCAQMKKAVQSCRRGDPVRDPYPAPEDCHDECNGRDD